MTGRLTLGYREAVAVRDSPVARAGERVRGHEFHRTVGSRAGRAPSPPGSGPRPARMDSPRRIALPPTSISIGLGCPQMATRFVGAAA